MLKKSLLFKSVVVALSLGISGCDRSSTNASTAVTAQAALKSGIELANLDPQIKPQDDFYRYVNGNWLKKTEIPADKPRWGAFDELRFNAEQQVLQLVQQQAAKPAEGGSDAQKIGDLYRAYLNTQKLEQLKLQPLQPLLAEVDNVQSLTDLMRFWGTHLELRAGSPLQLMVSQDQKESTRYITGMNQAGLGLPDRDYYLKSDEKTLQVQKQYQWFIARLWDAAGWQGGNDAAATVWRIETQLAAMQWSRVENRDRNKTYNKLSKAELTTLLAPLDVNALLVSAGLGHAEDIVVRQPTYLSKLAAFVPTVSLQDWQTYLKFHMVRSHATWLSSDFEQANFDFYGRVLNGLQAQKPRETRAVEAINDALGHMVGKMYVEKYFKPEAKARMEQLIKNLRVAFAQSIDGLVWMSPETKQQAQEKLKKFNAKIGYPEVWRDYSCVTISPDDLVGNMQRSMRCEYQRMIGRLGKPVDRNEWGMTPQTVNAYYSSTMNEIVFPAAILQPPFFNVAADDAVNYGAIGGVIGHEITHGFDDQGRRSDGDGNLRDWWTEQDAAQFTQRAQMMIDQYNQYNPIDDLHVQGALTLGENIADLGGLTVAYRAYQNSLQGKTAPQIDGFTGDKRFFIGWSQVWRTKFRDEALRQQLITDPHSPGMYRVKGVLSNMPEFYQAYDIKPEDGMYRSDEQRIKIW